MPDQAANAQTRSWRVPEVLRDLRLDLFVRRCLPHLSRRAVQDALGEKLFWINNRVGKKGDRLSPGDRLTFRGPPSWLAASPLPDAELHVPILYEDAAMMVLDKPAGIATHGFSGPDTMTLANFLMAQRPALAAIGKSRWEPGLAHRLDRETSGLVLVAKTQEAFDDLRRQFRGRGIKKIYWALVWGTTEPARTISFPIAHDLGAPGRMRAVVGGKTKSRGQKSWKALTEFRTLCTKKEMSLVEIAMATGVTHQIRVHLSTIGHPIVGDSLYGAASSERFGLGRHFLHARHLQFRHPVDGRTIEVESKLPAELQEVLKRLKIKN